MHKNKIIAIISIITIVWSLAPTFGIDKPAEGPRKSGPTTSKASQEEATYLKRGEKFLNEEQPQKAVEQFTDIIEKNPGNAYAYCLRGSAYLMDKKHEAAILDAESAMEIIPDNALPYILRGMAKTQQKKYDDAIADLSKAIQLAPKRPEPYVKRGITYGQKKGSSTVYDICEVKTLKMQR